MLTYSSGHMPGFSVPGPLLNINTVFPDMKIPVLKIRRSRDPLVFNLGIPILVKRRLYIDMAPWLRGVKLLYLAKYKGNCYIKKFLNPKPSTNFLTRRRRWMCRMAVHNDRDWRKIEHDELLNLTQPHGNKPSAGTLPTTKIGRIIIVAFNHFQRVFT